MVKTTTTYKIGGIGHAILCETCLREFYRRDVLVRLALLVIVLPVIFVVALLVLGPLEIENLPLFLAFIVIGLPVTGAVVYYQRLRQEQYRQDTWHEGYRGLGSRLAINLRRPALSAEGWKLFWTPSEFAESGIHRSVS